MDYQNSLSFARHHDEQDTLREFKNEFLFPKYKGKNAIYLCGNSLGLQPKSARKYITEQLTAWEEHGVEGWFQGTDPWLSYHKQLLQPLADLLGAQEKEITIMNSLTVNIHLLMITFYKPDTKRYKILMEAGAFPSDQYAVESQLQYHGFNPQDALIQVSPREGEVTLRTEDILQTIKEHENELALVMFSGINYYTGQFFDLAAITKTAHEAGAYAGFDLAHAAGNVPVSLHDTGADFASWCSYKYMNSGPGGVSGIFIHEKHFNDQTLHRFAGWWGYRHDKRFLMEKGFEPEVGAEGWNISTAPVMLLALHKASLDLFKKAGGLLPLRAKSETLTGYLEFLIGDINQKKGEEIFKVITPKAFADRGCQLSLVCKYNAKEIFSYLADNGVTGDWREPDVIRLAPVPLYNSYEDVFEAAGVLSAAADIYCLKASKC